MKACFLFLILNTCLFASTAALFEPQSVNIGPFPSNVLTASDPSQATGLRVNLPSDSATACGPATTSAVCGYQPLLNQLDGFSVHPRIMACFSGPVNASTLPQGIFLVPVSQPDAGEIGVQQVIFDPQSNCAFAKPVQVLAEQSEYLLVVSNAVHDATNTPVVASAEFADCIGSAPESYCQALAEALHQPSLAGIADSIVDASLFTTMSATTWLEKARNYVDATELPIVLPAGWPTTFSIRSIQSMQWIPSDTNSAPVDIPVSALSGVGTVAFGFFLSPNFLSTSGTEAGAIPTTPTAAPIALPSPLLLPISFHVFLPASPAPPGGYPVVIYGHGLGDNQFGAPTYMASTLAQHGFATLAFEVTGHGYGSGGEVQIVQNNGQTSTLSAPGRGVLLPGNAQIGPTDGCIVPGPIGIRDCVRQTAVDLVALYDTIRRTHGLWLNLDPNRVSYVGQSLGSIYGTLFAAIEPGVKTFVLNGDGGSEVDIARLSISGRPEAIAYLALTNPALFNGSIAPPEPYFHDVFNDNYVFPGSGPVVNAVPGAMAIQSAFETADWLDMLGDSLSYAPHLKLNPLAGVPPKQVLFQFGYGDLEVPNPTESAVVLAAGGLTNTSFFNFQTAVQYSSGALLAVTMDMGGVNFPILPHRILSNPTIFTETLETPLALAEQQQAAMFFGSSGTTIVDPDQFLSGTPYEGQNLFTVPATPAALPEALNFLQITP
jgi:pimeloyl-ACP methyl ester carboxylesterase